MKVKHYIFVGCLVLFFSTCRKFTEDKFISFKTVKARLKGNWRVKYINYNASDITNTYSDSLNISDINAVIFGFSFDRDNGYRNQTVDDVSINGKDLNGNDTNLGRNYFELYPKNKKKINSNLNIYFTLNGSPTALTRLLGSSYYFEIKKLYRNELHMVNPEYDILLHKIK